MIYLHLFGAPCYIFPCLNSCNGLEVNIILHIGEVISDSQFSNKTEIEMDLQRLLIPERNVHENYILIILAFNQEQEFS